MSSLINLRVRNGGLRNNLHWLAPSVLALVIALTAGLAILSASSSTPPNTGAMVKVMTTDMQMYSGEVLALSQPSADGTAKFMDCKTRDVMYVKLTGANIAYVQMDRTYKISLWKTKFATDWALTRISQANTGSYPTHC